MRDGGLRSSVLILLSAATAIDALASLTGTASKHYGIVFDAGSSGTRIHVYTWQTGGGGAKNDFDLVSDDLLKIKPGLSAFKDTPAKAGASLAPLIEFAKAKVPADQAATTPIFLMATAGLRMVGESAKDAILASVCDYLTTTGYLFRREWATLLGGRDEGLYGWVTVRCSRCARALDATTKHSRAAPVAWRMCRLHVACARAHVRARCHLLDR